MTQTNKTRSVLFDHDGGVDDFLALLMLLAMPHVELVGMVVTPGCCYWRSAVSASFKMLRYFQRLAVPLSVGRLSGTNPFPDEWRVQSAPIDALPLLNELTDPLPKPSPKPGDEFVADYLRTATDPITVLVTGPLTNLATALTREPRLSSKIEEVVWMGGALSADGNVEHSKHDGSAEWNAFWDPGAVRDLWRSSAPVTLVPLDATNQVSFKSEFLLRLAQQRRHALSDLAGQCLALTVAGGEDETLDQYKHWMWDTLAAGYLGAPDLMTFREARVSVVADGKSSGRLVEGAPNGKVIKVADEIRRGEFLDYVLGLFRD